VLPTGTAVTVEDSSKITMLIRSALQRAPEVRAILNKDGIRHA
jgi:hypothetical protein